ncbi:hypothetical protein MLD38_039588 [Melastoma candidum]|nr:hypothetical protein MLD38_039588 [Melastoma candidum]
MDVFSFGVVLLELISGKEAIDEEGNVLWASATDVFGTQGSSEDDEDEVGRSKRVRAWMDESLVEDSFPFESVVNVMGLAVACVNKDPSKRPSMVDIVYALCKSDDFVLDVSEDGLSAPPVLAR